MIKSYVINLDRNPERLAHIDKRLKQLGLPYERIAAVDGKAVPQHAFEAFAAARPMEGSGDSYSSGKRKWNPSNMGCFLSHYDAWQHIAQGPDEYGAVFEDDIYISADVVPLLSSSDWIPQTCDIVKLEDSYNRIKTGVAQARVAGRTIKPVIPSPYDHCWPVCCGGLIIARDTARKLIESPADSQMLADIFLFAPKESPMARQLSVYQVCPAVCVQDKFLYKDQSASVFKSNIDDPDAEKPAYNATQSLMTKMNALLRILQGYRKIPYQE